MKPEIKVQGDLNELRAVVQQLAHRAAREPSLRGELERNPAEALMRAGIGFTPLSQIVVYQRACAADGGDSCLDPPETNHYAPN